MRIRAEDLRASMAGPQQADGVRRLAGALGFTREQLARLTCEELVLEVERALRRRPSRLAAHLARRSAGAGTVALALTACVAPEVTVDTEPTPPPEVYVAHADATTQRRVEEVHAEARCDAGDVVLGGGCSWGARRAPERAYPLEVIEDRPSDDGAGWLCVGQQDGVGVELEVLRASAVCLVAGGVS